MMLSGLARHQARGLEKRTMEEGAVGWSWRGSNGAVGWGWHSGQLFVSLAGSRPEQLPFLFLAAALCLVQRDDSGSKWRACGQPLLLLQASRPFASCDWLFATCIAREVPEVPAGGSQNCGGSPSSISSGCCCCCSRMNLSTRCMTGKNFRLILLAAYVSASLFRCAADFRPRRREVAARLPVTGALDRPLLVLPFLGCTCTFSAVGVEPTVNVTPANVAVWRPFLRPALSTATSPCFATESVASMASKCSWSERAATSEGAPAMGKRPNMETFFFSLNRF